MERVLYTCDRCGTEKLSDRSYWEHIYHCNLLKRDKTLLCPICFECFVKFLEMAN